MRISIIYNFTNQSQNMEGNMPSMLEKVQAIKRYRQIELIGEIGDWNREELQQAKQWARELGINWVFDPNRFNPQAVASRIQRIGDYPTSSS